MSTSLSNQHRFKKKRIKRSSKFSGGEHPNRFGPVVVRAFAYSLSILVCALLLVVVWRVQYANNEVPGVVAVKSAPNIPVACDLYLNCLECHVLSEGRPLPE